MSNGWQKEYSLNMNKPGKLEIIADESVCWAGNQIGFFESPTEISVDRTRENFRNCEFTSEEVEDVLNNWDDIVGWLEQEGYTVIENEDDQDDE